MKKTLVQLLALLMTFSMVACAAKTAEPAEASAEEPAKETHVVGISTLPATSLSSSLVLQGIIDGAAQKGWETKEASCSDVESQINGIETLIEAGVDVIAVGAIDNNALTPVLEKARNAGIKIFDTYALPEELSDVACSFSQREFGYALGYGAGSYAADAWGDEAFEVLIFTSTTSPMWIERSDGVVEGLEASGANVTVAATEEAWETEEALSATESVLQAHPDVRMVLAINDAASLGAFTAFQNAGKTDSGEYFIGGIDLVPQVLKYMTEGTTYKGGVYLDLYQQSVNGTVAAIDLYLNGSSERQVIPVDHMYVQFDDTDTVNEILDLYASLGY